MALSKAQQRIAEKNRKYWAEREAEQLKHYITNEAEYDKQIKQIYENMLDSVQKEIDSFYGKYASKEGITIAEAKKRVSRLDIEAYERKAKRYVRDKDFSQKANEEMQLYNLTMKINRLEMLKANIGLELIAGHDELEKFMAEILQGRAAEELERQAGILGKTIKNNAKLAHSIPNASFHNATFSDRIWMHQELLKADLEKLLQSGLIAGKNPRVLARDIRNRFEVKISDAERLMRAELARVQTDAQKKSLEANGFEKYQFIVNGGCCPICEAIAKSNNGIYLVKDMMPGTNAPPMHPHCRCGTAAYEDSEEYEAWLDYLDGGGSTDEYNVQKSKTVSHIPANEEMAEKRKAVSELLAGFGANVDKEGNVTLYHATAKENVNSIKRNGFKPTSAPVNGGTGGETIKQRVFFSYNRDWVASVWSGNGSYEILKVKIPAEYLHQFGKNTLEIVVEGNIKETESGVWVPDTLPTSTAWDRKTVKRWKKKKG